MKRILYRSFHCVMVLGIFALIAGGCAHAEKGYKPAGPVECDAEISWDVASEAEVSLFKCYIDKYKKKHESIHYTIVVKNISNEPQRYRVNIFIPEGRAVGGLLPRKGKPPVLKPGEEAKFTYPMKNFAQIPESMDVVIQTISVD